MYILVLRVYVNEKKTYILFNFTEEKNVIGSNIKKLKKKYIFVLKSSQGNNCYRTITIDNRYPVACQLQ